MTGGARAGDAAPCVHCGLPVPPSRRGGDTPWFCCLGCRVAHQIALPALSTEADIRSASTRLLRLGTGIFLAINVMIASWLSYSRELLGLEPVPGGAEAQFLQLAAYAALFLCTLVVVLLGAPLALDSIRALVAGRRFDAQLLVVVGVVAAFALSVLHTVRGSGPLYFDTAAVVLVVVTLGAHLESRAKQRSGAVATRRLVELPRRVKARRGRRWRELDVDEVVPGDIIEVLPGGIVPVDGSVTEGTSRLDESSFTGESRPRLAEVGSRVLAGSLNHEGRLRITATTPPDGTVLASIERSLEEARNVRPPIQRLADRVAAVFVPGVIALAVGLFAWNVAHGNAETGLMRALSVLLISCPCALGLAAPLATWHGLRRAAERGIVIDSPTTLERIAALERIFLDKTGTLTRPEPALERVELAQGVDLDWALSAAASLEASSTHPIAVELVERGAALRIEPKTVSRARTVAGRGVEAFFDGRRLRLGSRRWVRELGVHGLRHATTSDSDPSLYLMDDRRVLARIGLAERLRSDARETIQDLERLGLPAAILTGDELSAAQRIGDSLGIPAIGALLPEAKVEAIERFARLGPVAMVGDGLNDVPVLSAASVGFALGSATDLAQRSGNVRLTSDRLSKLPEAVRLARHVESRIRLNLAFAFGFNSIGIALAAAGLLSPIFAAVAMAVSSLGVLRISSRAGAVTEAEAETTPLPATAAPAEATG